MWWMNNYIPQNNNVITCPCISASLSLFKWRCFVSTLGVILNYMGTKRTLLWIIYMIETRYRSRKKIHRTDVAVLHCPGCVLTSNLRCLDIFTSTRLWLLPIAGVAKNLGSSSLLSSFAGGETCNWRCFTVNWTTLHTTGLADMAQATPSHGPGLQLSPCGSSCLCSMWFLSDNRSTHNWHATAPGSTHGALI